MGACCSSSSSSSTPAAGAATVGPKPESTSSAQEQRRDDDETASSPTAKPPTVTNSLVTVTTDGTTDHHPNHPETSRPPPDNRTSQSQRSSTHVVVPGTDEEGNTNVGAEPDRNTLEDLDYLQIGPTSLQEELNEIMEAMYALCTEEDFQTFQRHLDDVEQQQIAQRALKAVSPAPDFDLLDQDGERVSLSQLCQKGPVVLQFYRGKWCPHCNAGLMAYNRVLDQFDARGATFVAISPMLPDGSQFLASKRDLKFAVLSDVGNTVARQFNITFRIPEDIRPLYPEMGMDVSVANGDDLWEIPVIATYIINSQQTIVWSFIDNCYANWAEPTDVVKALDLHCGAGERGIELSFDGVPTDKDSGVNANEKSLVNHNSTTRGYGVAKHLTRPTGRDAFGPNKASAKEHFFCLVLPTSEKSSNTP